MSLTVLLDGHRKKVPVTAGTSMSDVLRKACELHDVDADRHELRHKNAIVDLSLPFRLTGISSNATLDMMAKRGGANDPVVRVCVQLVDGRRVQGNFGSSLTLAAILAQLQIHLSPEYDSLNFMRRDIRGPELDSLTLQALGLLSGSGMFRVQSSTSSPVAPPRVVAAPTPSATHVAAPMPAAAPLTPALAPVAAAPEPAVSAPSPLPSTPYDAIQRVRNSNFDAVSSTVVLTLMKILCNILSKPDEPKVRSIRTSNPKFVDAVGRHPGGIAFLVASGFAIDGDMLHLASESSDVLQAALRVLHTEADDLRIDHSARPQVQAPSSLPAPAFDAYQPLITRMQAQPRGASLTEMRLDDLKKKQDALLASSTPARQTRILFPHELQHAAMAAPTTVGKSDAQLLAQALKARQDAAEKSQSFRTLAMRELDDMQRRSVYQEAVLRVRFPDKVVLQAVFHPSEPLQAVADLVTSCLATPRAFYLYTTPPMTKLDATKSLLDLHLVPASNVFLGWTSPPTASTELGAYLNHDIVATYCPSALPVSCLDAV
ncbi:hypothetical protein, variant [Saprolegnia diclina VS20]|uniref:UBX domain-containing protein n=1 Tax=Saprolegnia diclina (strain VS20) TaxID=1156394 RepID=T0SID8_SAPDV|nr:hypothetical protein, variant [Saprolegnia diclina VS20]EQC42687.1 hypothetical protein, variant [Saprolegnia diclina VS20]|eukprot:XP_008604110.1 hypothetical protein, variant [Saprolegnia diclina VS20]